MFNLMIKAIEKVVSEKGTIVIRALLIVIHREAWRMPGYFTFEYITPQKLPNEQEGKKKNRKKKASI